MSNESPHRLCLDLIHADSEEEVIELLGKAGYWERDEVWRYYGDIENNWATIGNQQSRPEAALVEKLVNSVDARLIQACFEAGIDPEGEQAPSSIREAVARFFDPINNPTSGRAGRISEWPDQDRTRVAQEITLTATGPRPRQGFPCFTVSDRGEGQTPLRFPDTLLSLHQSNKLKTPFVQGKFNMGGTGALRYCGRNNLQLVVSRRNPKLLPACDETGKLWGFTVVRRHQEGTRTRNTVYSYLAPTSDESEQRKGNVLCFAAPSLPIFPKGSSAYAQHSEWGTLIKLYNYQIKKRSHILRRDGLLNRLDLLLPHVALPIRLHECRNGYRGHRGSFASTLTGFRVRLDDNKADNLEFEPSSADLRVHGERIQATVFAFKKGRAETYTSNNGVIFTINGQTHGHLTRDFFRRRKVGMSYLRDSILVIVDCSRISARAREDLFMNSRDRLSKSDLRYAIERELESLLKNHQGLRDLRERRRREEIESRLADDKPLQDVLESVFKSEPSLTDYLLKGRRISNPFRRDNALTPEPPFLGHTFPTFFYFKGKRAGEKLVRDCQLGRRARIAFVTDAASDYFTRDVDPGTFRLIRVTPTHRFEVDNHSINLHGGTANLHVTLPHDCAVGDTIVLTALTNDPTQVSPFENKLTLRVVPRSETTPGPSPTPRVAGLNLPKVIDVPESQWEQQNPAFTDETALRIKHVNEPGGAAKDDGHNQDTFDFYVNTDNLYLKSFLKAETKGDAGNAKLVEAQFKCGLVLIGLSLIRQDARNQARNGVNRGAQSDEEEVQLEDDVEKFASAVAAVLLPVVRSLGDLQVDEEDSF